MASGVALKADAARGLIASTLRAVPWLPAHRSLSRGLNAACLKRGGSPLVQAPMRLGYRMWVDLRTRSQFYAYYSGKYDNAFLARLIRLMQPGGCVLDVGANVGFYTVALAQATQRMRGTLHAFEPLPSNCERLTSNLELNGLATALRVWPIGLSNEERTAHITLREDFKAGADTGNASIVIGEHADGGFKRVDIQLRTLDQFCKAEALERVDLIKADIEGHEDLLLEGGRASFEKWRPVLFMEVNKQYYAWRGVDLAARLHELLPRDYVTLKSQEGRGERWYEIPDINVCGRLDNVFIVPRERLEPVLRQLG